jgi:hypothetical protein
MSTLQHTLWIGTAGKPNICGSDLDQLLGWVLQGLVAPAVACGCTG